MTATLPFWKRKSLAEMSNAEWESLCDGCGRCCLHKLRDEETGALAFTNVACRLLDTKTCRCTDYTHRHREVPDCVRLTPEALAEIDWLPPSCAYRRLAEGRDLPPWHPLLTGDPGSVHRAGASVSERAVRETEGGALENHVVAWPGRMPRPRAVGRRLETEISR
ncbi:MAG: YcgN family cysteine cluster protein [Rhodospirillales bacterium]|nr:YcgN family cysteine cluster protein [Rhodospirillales bacterium]